MNREGRARLRKAAERFNRESRQSLATFTASIESLRDEEQAKLDNLPKQLASSVKGDQLSDSVNSLDAMLSGADEMSEALESILSEQGLSFSFIPETKSERIESKGRAGVQFHAMLKSSLLSAMMIEVMCFISPNNHYYFRI